MANLGFNPNIPNAGFQAGQSMHVQGAGSGMLMDLVAEWKKQRGEQRAFQMEEKGKAPERELAQKKFEADEKYRQDALKQDAIANAYKIAQDSAKAYLENPDVGDEKSSKTAQAIAAYTFDNYMRNTGFEDTTYLDMTQSDRGPISIDGETPISAPMNFPDVVSGGISKGLAGLGNLIPGAAPITGKGMLEARTQGPGFPSMFQKGPGFPSMFQNWLKGKKKPKDIIT